MEWCHQPFLTASFPLMSHHIFVFLSEGAQLQFVIHLKHFSGAYFTEWLTDSTRLVPRPGVGRSCYCDPILQMGK